MLRPTFPLLALLTFWFTSCDISHEELYEEPITSALFILTPDSGTTVILQYLDRDGEGGRPAIINSGSLQPNTTYQAELLLNTIGKHIIDTSSVTRNPENYQAFFIPQNGLELTSEYNDYDANGFPVGLHSKIKTMEQSEGSLTIIIKRNPNKSGSGVSMGDVTNAGGKTSFEVSFDVTVEGCP